MLQAGYVFCVRCGHATADAYYYSFNLSCWVQLKRNAFGKVFAEIYTPDYMQGDGAVGLVESVEFCPMADESRIAMRHKVLVRCRLTNGKTTVEEFVRCCPFCVGGHSGWNSVQELIPGMGEYPTYVVAVIGSRSVGKSCWIHALSCPSNITAANYCRHHNHGYEGYTLDPVTYTQEERVPRLPSTTIGSLGKTNVLTISHRTGNKTHIAAQVLVLDFPGELFAEDSKELYEKSAAHIFEGGVGFGGVDAVIFITDPNDGRNVDPSEEEPGSGNFITTYNRINTELKLLNNIPVAFVMNKVDTLFDTKVTIGGQACAPLVSEKTFAVQGEAMYRKAAMLPRVALQNMLLKKIQKMVSAAEQQVRCSGFLIKATTPYYATDTNDNGQMKMFLNFKESINVMDPILWVLNELDIFPIEDIM